MKNITSDPVALFDPAFPTNTWKLAGLDYFLPPDLMLPPNSFALLVPTTASVESLLTMMNVLKGGGVKPGERGQGLVSHRHVAGETTQLGRLAGSLEEPDRAVGLRVGGKVDGVVEVEDDRKPAGHPSLHPGRAEQRRFPEHVGHVVAGEAAELGQTSEMSSGRLPKLGRGSATPVEHVHAEGRQERREGQLDSCRPQERRPLLDAIALARDAAGRVRHEGEDPKGAGAGRDRRQAAGCMVCGAASAAPFVRRCSSPTAAKIR